MTTANCPGNEELDFRLIFGEEEQQQPLGPADLEPDDNTSFYILNVGPSQSMVTNHQSIGLPRHGMQSHSHVISTSPRLQSHKPGSEPPSYEAQDKYGTSPLLPSAPVEAPKAFECPSIQITSISPSCQQEMDANEEDLRANGPDGDYHSDRPLSRDHLYLRLDHSYRDSSLSPSPCSSLSSRSWFSDASSCESFSHVYDDVDSELNEAAARFTLGSPLTSPGCTSPQTGVGVLEEQTHWQHHHPAFVHHSHSISLSPRQSPCHSPRTSVTDENWLSPRPPSRPSSRPTSPCGKRRHSSADICYPSSVSPHHSPTPTPGPSPRGSVTEDTWVGSPSVGMSPFQCCPSEADIPSKTRKTSQDRTAMQTGKGELGLDDQGNMSPNLDSPSEEAMHSLKKDGPGEQFLSVPSHFSWNKPKPGHTPIFSSHANPHFLGGYVMAAREENIKGLPSAFDIVPSWLEVPPYHSKTVGSAVQVHFYVCNGKRKRSQSQRFTYLSVMVKQEHRDELDLPAVPPISMPLAHAASLVRTQLPSPEQGHPSDNLLSSSPHGLATGSGPGLLPLQAPCPSLGSPSFQHLPHLQGHSLHHPPADCHMTFHPSSAPATSRPSYQPLQHSQSHGHSLLFNGQSSLPPQGYERIPFQQSPSAASHPMGMGMMYPSSPCSSPSAPSSSATNPIVGSPQSQQPLLSPSSPHLHTLGGYHCSPNPTQVPSPGGHPLVGQHSSQLQRAMCYHPVSQRSASCPTPSSAPPPQMIPSPHSGPSSPQLQSLPYQSPTSSSPTSCGSPLGPLQQQHSGQPSPQATSPVMVSLSPVAAGPLVHPLSPQGPFPSDGERLNIKQEPEDREPTFRSIGLQDITLDDAGDTGGEKTD
ncbi:hypothetical protein PAMP_000725 [Pampus punctatissimus]